MQKVQGELSTEQCNKLIAHVNEGGGTKLVPSDELHRLMKTVFRLGSQVGTMRAVYKS